MIHQHIFASPKPGMSEAEFQRYWLEVHAVKYASKIKQIKKYLIGTRLDWPGQNNPAGWSGIAEIWLRDEKEQLESLQSPEFLQGARLDEPKWAAFWNTLVLDTDAHVLLAGEEKAGDRVKLVTLVKRKPGLSVAEFRRHALEVHAPLTLKLPGIRRCLYCLTRDSWYTLGEPRFDGLAQYCLDDLAALEAMVRAPLFQNEVLPDAGKFLEPKYTFTMACKEHWIIGPKPRA